MAVVAWAEVCLQALGDLCSISQLFNDENVDFSAEPSICEVWGSHSSVFESLKSSGILGRVDWYRVGDVSNEHWVFAFKDAKMRLPMLDPEDEGNTFFRNVSNYLPVTTA
jgi:hypothetical protein